MDKTIEELAKESATAAYDGGEFQTDNEHERGIRDLANAFMRFYTNGIMALSLADRLTDAEKEMVRKTYKAMSDYGKKKDVMCADCANYAARVGLERIFGKEFFKEDKL